MCNQLCVVPPSPELEEKIIRAKARMLAGQAQPASGDELDDQTAMQILTRPPKTRAHTLVSPTAEFAPVLGGRKAIVLLVDFSDKPSTQSQSHYEQMLFSVGTYASGSMRDFYQEASYNQLDVTGEVRGWYRMPHPKSYYANNEYGFGQYPHNAQKLTEDAITAAEAAGTNFTPYDNSGNAVIEAVIVIAAGSGGETTGNKGDIWSHKWGINTKVVDGKQIQTYFMAPEDGRVGVMSHELGHLLMSWPDLYDTDYSSRGTGRWDLMAGGSWNGGGNTPAHPSAWCKVKAGWVTPITVFNAAQDVRIQPYANSPQVYRLPVGSAASKEYFLVSNRQKTRFDSDLPGEGCIIEHVDDNQSNNTDETHYLVDIEQADGERHLNSNANAGDGSDPFPTATNDAFAAATNPNSNSYSGSDSKVSVTDIRRSGDLITARINVGDVAVQAWHSNRAVQQCYTSYHSQNCWARIGGLGWRKIETANVDGVTNMFIALVAAQANNKQVSVYADDTKVYRMYML